jgi:triphosphoribosyl-dephospho-CoA synthase
MLEQAQIAAAYEAACQAEIDALKPGNVHRFADGHRMTADHFLDSARLTAPIIADGSVKPGRRILEAVRVTREQVGTNTNLGIILLCVPLACAAEMRAPKPRLQQRVADVLEAIDMEDTAAIFQAILIASPGGLGSAPKHDVREAPSVTILGAMAAAAGRDMIAHQYVSGFRDIFLTGLAALEAARDAGETGMWPTVFAYLSFLSSFDDSHILRRHGVAAARQVRDEAVELLAQLSMPKTEAERIDTLLSVDRTWKAEDLNPGTTADMTVAAYFASELMRLEGRIPEALY